MDHFFPERTTSNSCWWEIVMKAVTGSERWLSMNEQDWRTCNDPKRMLDFLRSKSTDRKLRLFTCGFFRTFWHRKIDEESLVALETSEHFADGLATAEELQSSRERARQASRSGNESAEFAANTAALDANWAAGRLLGHATNDLIRRNQVEILQDLWGPLPFRHVPMDSSWLSPKVAKLAHSIYDDRAFGRLAVLADALEEAGCHDSDIISHCRGPCLHVRGCWVLDLILGKA